MKKGRVIMETMAHINEQVAFLKNVQHELQSQENNGQGRMYAMTEWSTPKVEQLLHILATFDWDAFLPSDEKMENTENEFEEDDNYGIRCVYISKDDFLKAVQIDEYVSFILPLEWQHENIESVIKEMRECEEKMYADDDEDFNPDAYIQLLKKHKIQYWTEIQ